MLDSVFPRDSWVFRICKFFKISLLTSCKYILSPFFFLIYHIFDTDNDNVFEVIIVFFTVYFLSVRDFKMWIM